MSQVRRYYSARTGRGAKTGAMTLELLQRLTRETYLAFVRRGYFDELLGHDCVDQGLIPGRGGSDIAAYVFRRTRTIDIWPIPEWRERRLSETDLFDVIEFLFDHVSQPVKGWNHSYCDCGMHWEEFDALPGRQEFRTEMNGLLRDFGTGWQLTDRGEITQIPPAGMERLLDAKLPDLGEAAVQERVDAARRKFEARGARPADRRDAIRDLADVLELLRPKLKQVLTSADENDLFNLANNFGIRHLNEKQRTAYDQDIWFSWMFYYYLATIHAATRMIQRHIGSSEQNGRGQSIQLRDRE